MRIVNYQHSRVPRHKPATDHIPTRALQICLCSREVWKWMNSCGLQGGCCTKRAGGRLDQLSASDGNTGTSSSAATIESRPWCVRSDSTSSTRQLLPLPVPQVALIVPVPVRSALACFVQDRFLRRTIKEVNLRARTQPRRKRFPAGRMMSFDS